MAKRTLRLIYSAAPSDMAEKGRETWGLENAQQLSLFDEVGRIPILFIPIADVSPRHFIRALDEKEPYLVIDTRAFPDFLSVFPSVGMALEEFNRRGIKYDRIPLNIDENEYSRWSKNDHIKNVFLMYLDKKTTAPIFVISSTKKSIEKISTQIKEYINQEISEAKIQEISY